MDGILESVPLFYGRKDGSEYPVKYLGAINFLVEEKYTDNIKASMVKQLVFRACLRDNADKWFQRQNEATRLDWAELSRLFELEYKITIKTKSDPNRYFKMLYNLKQGRKPIT